MSIFNFMYHFFIILQNTIIGFGFYFIQVQPITITIIITLIHVIILT